MHNLQLNNYHSVNWIDFYSLLSKFSHSLRNKDVESLNVHMVDMIYQVLSFARQNDIDMRSSWCRWKSKVDFKHYY